MDTKRGAAGARARCAGIMDAKRAEGRSATKERCPSRALASAAPRLKNFFCNLVKIYRVEGSVALN